MFHFIMNFVGEKNSLLTPKGSQAAEYISKTWYGEAFFRKLSLGGGSRTGGGGVF